jgi:hypothetical protein
LPLARNVSRRKKNSGKDSWLEFPQDVLRLEIQVTEKIAHIKKCQNNGLSKCKVNSSALNN